ncbi:MAG: hypothetical protein ABW208_24760 [Pyrinomonadaceae bacterium]
MEPSEEELNALHERALRLLNEAAELANIRDISEYRNTPAYYARYWGVIEEDWGKKGEWPKSRWNVFKYALNGDIILCIQINRVEGIVWLETSLRNAAVDLIRSSSKMLEAPDADKLFNISSPEEREEAIDYNVCSILRGYISHLPTMLAQSVERAYEDSVQRQIKTSIEPQLREHWSAIGLPRDFDLMSRWERHSYGKQLEEVRNIFIGAKKPPISEEELRTLPKQYDELRLEYRKAKKYHDETRELFFAARNRNDKNAWRTRWEQDGMTLFPNLFYVSLIMICDGNYQPRELAYQHLAYKYRHSPEYIRKLISSAASRTINRKKSRKAISKRRPLKS